MNIDRLIYSFRSGSMDDEGNNAVSKRLSGRWLQLRAVGVKASDILRHDRFDGVLVMKDGRKIPFI